MLFYHGTTWTRAQRIRVEGLRPLFDDQANLTVNKAYAIGYAYGWAEDEHDIPALITFSGEPFGLVQMEPEEGAGEAWTSIYKSYGKTIPAEAIIRIEKLPIKQRSF